MSVTELKERHLAATETVNTLKERLKQRRLSLLDTDIAGYARSQGKTPVTYGPTDLVCCRTLQGHTGKVIYSPFTKKGLPYARIYFWVNFTKLGGLLRVQEPMVAYQLVGSVNDYAITLSSLNVNYDL